MILLVNPNQYKKPPVPPVGLEYLSGELKKNNYRTELLDLCFSDNPKHDLINAISLYKPDIVGFTIRQVDTGLYSTIQFLLDDIKKYVDICKVENKKVILGGAGFSIMPEEILDYSGADFGVYGPGTKAICNFMDMLDKNSMPPRVINGFNYFEKGKIHNSYRTFIKDYRKYIDNGAIAGFNTQTGCYGNCIFCTENNKPVIFLNPECVASEINYLLKSGVDRFHLCDSEFNQNIEHCITVCKSIYNTCGKINWTLYMKSRPYSNELFYWLKKSGAELITLSLDSLNDNPDTFDSLAELFALAESNGIKVAIDLSVGIPGEKEDCLEKIAVFLQKQSCVTIGVNAFYRIYPGTPLCNYIKENYGEIKKHLISYSAGSSLVKPAFYNHISVDKLRKIFNGDKFRMEGFEQTVNYQRI